jgi:hypothetical protein
LDESFLRKKKENKTKNKQKNRTLFSCESGHDIMLLAGVCVCTCVCKCVCMPVCWGRETEQGILCC